MDFQTFLISSENSSGVRSGIQDEQSALRVLQAETWLAASSSGFWSESDRMEFENQEFGVRRVCKKQLVAGAGILLILRYLILFGGLGTIFMTLTGLKFDYPSWFSCGTIRSAQILSSSQVEGNWCIGWVPKQHLSILIQS